MGTFVLQSPIRRRSSGDDRWIRRGVVVAALALGAGMLAGSSGASSPSTYVHFTPLDPPHKVMSNSAIAANATKVVVVTGGTTQVPTNATTLQLTISVKGTKAGRLSFHPYGNPAGSTGQTVSWAAGGTGSGTIETDVGQRNSLSVTNHSAAGATVTATITGYSTEVEARDISGIGGSAGQVLTNTGGGATWQTPAAPIAPFVVVAGTDPPALPEVALGTRTITTPRSAKLFVQGHSNQVSAFCDGSTTVTVGIYLDGVPVPGSALTEIPQGSNNHTLVFGVTSATVPAGQHTVAMGVTCDGPIRFTAVGIRGARWSVAAAS